MKMLLEGMLRETIICPTKVKKWHLSVFIVPIVSIVFFLRILENRYLLLDLKLGISIHVLSQQLHLTGHLTLGLPHVDS